MDRGAWQATVHRVAQSWTQLKRLSTFAHVLTPKYHPQFLTTSKQSHSCTMFNYLLLCSKPPQRQVA